MSEAYRDSGHEHSPPAYPQGEPRLTLTEGHNEAQPADILQDFTSASASEITPELISRLLIAHRDWHAEGPKGQATNGITEQTLHRFLRSTINNDLEEAHTLLDELIDEGMLARDLLRGLIEGTAHELGHLWEKDTVSFIDVTTALCTLHQVLRERTWSDGPTPWSVANGLKILLTTFDQEQHSLGVTIVGEVFRQAGWGVKLMPGSPFGEVKRSLSQSDIDVLGISMSQCAHPEKIAADIGILRASSKKPGLSVIIGGYAVIQDPDVWKSVGADACVDDADFAPDIAKGLQELGKARI